MNPHLKRFAERSIVLSGAVPLLRSRRRHDALVLAYHNIIPVGGQPGGDRSLHITQQDFARQLDLLADAYDVVPLASLFESEARSSTRPRVAITFDDAYDGAVTVGIEELVRRRLPATVFVTPGLLGLLPWWDVIASSEAGAVPEANRHHALETLCGDRELVLDWAGLRAAAEGNSPAHLRIATELQVRDASRAPGIALGAHTWSHRNLSVLGADDLRMELARPMSWLRERFASVIDCVAYPYGLYAPAVERAAAACGYLGAFRVDGGWWTPRSGGNRFALPRLNIPASMSLDGFALRVAGLGTSR